MQTEPTRAAFAGQGKPYLSNDLGPLIADLKEAGLADILAEHTAAADMGLISPLDFLTALNGALGASVAHRALDSISVLFEPGDVLEIRVMNPLSPGAFSLCGRLSQPDERARLANFIAGYNGTHNIYFGVNPRVDGFAGTSNSANANDVAARRCIMLDLDLKDAPDVDPDWSQTLQELSARNPLLMTRSGNGFHVFLPIEPIVGQEALRASVKPLADAMDAIGADNMADLPRIARLPFTINLPTKSKLNRGAVPRLALPMNEGSHHD